MTAHIACAWPSRLHGSASLEADAHQAAIRTMATALTTERRQQRDEHRAARPEDAEERPDERGDDQQLDDVLREQEPRLREDAQHAIDHQHRRQHGQRPQHEDRHAGDVGAGEEQRR